MIQKMLSINNPNCKIVYKVVLIENNRFYSVAAPGKYRLEYILNSITMPVQNTLGLFVFNDLVSAKVFRCDDINMSILKCVTLETYPIHMRAIPCREKSLDGFYAMDETYMLRVSPLDYQGLVYELLPLEIVL